MRASRAIGGHGNQLRVRMPMPSVSLPELLDRAEALPSSLVDRARRVAAHAKTVTVRILDIHFASAPGHVRRGLANDRAALFVLLMKCVHVLHENGHPRAGLALSSFAEENLDLASGNAAESRRSAPVPFFGEAQLVDVAVHRSGEILDVQDRDQALEVIHSKAPEWTLGANGGK